MIYLTGACLFKNPTITHCTRCILYKICSECQGDINKAGFFQREDPPFLIVKKEKFSKETNKLINHLFDFITKLRDYKFIVKQIDKETPKLMYIVFENNNYVSKENISKINKGIILFKELNKIRNSIMVAYKDKIFDVLWALTDTNEVLAWRLCTGKVKPIPYDKIVLAMKCYPNKNTNIDMFISRFKMFLEFGFTDNFILEIYRNDASISRYTTNFCTVLKHLQAKGINPAECAGFIAGNYLSDNITKNIETLEVLNSLDNEDIALLQKDGINVYEKIQNLQKAIDVKRPIINTPKGNDIAALKVLANNGNADEIIRTMDLTQFETNANGHGGIPLEYSREEFIKNMNKLIAEYSSENDAAPEAVSDSPLKEIPALELSSEAQERVNSIIEDYKQKYSNNTKYEDIIIGDKTCTAAHFVNSKIDGSNPGDFYLIDNKLYYVKFPLEHNMGQSVEEVIASRLYRAAGINSPNEQYIYNKNGEVIGMASEYVPDMKPIPTSTSGQSVNPMYESFAVDAWLANWDAPHNNNTKMFDGGKVIKSDVGGSMHYRAQGELKQEFNATVIELLSLIENNNALYSNLTKQDILNSIQKVLEIPDEVIYKTVMSAPSHDAKLANIMIQRKAYMKEFAENLRNIEDNGQNIIDLIIEAQSKTSSDYREIPDIAGAFGYIPTDKGFEGLLNTEMPEKLSLTPEEHVIADKIKTEIERFTYQNRVSDKSDAPQEVKDFVNGILKGFPEFAMNFSKPQHSGHQYSLDIHILNVLQKSVKNPLYGAKDEFGFKLLDDESKLVLKFSALLHDIAKMQTASKDEGHAMRSAEYVYSVLSRFNLSTAVKNRIVNIVNHHHWFEELCTNQNTEQNIATTFRTTADFTIARILAQADIESVHEGYFLSRMSRNFPDEVHNEKTAYDKFNSIMDKIQKMVSKIEETGAIVTPSKFVEVPEHIGSDGKPVPRRGFPIVEIELDGKKETFKILNLNELSPDTDMYKYGFNHIKLKDLKFLVHGFGDRQWGKFTTTKILGENPVRQSVQSLTLLSPGHTSTYNNRNFACVIEGNNANIGVAYFKNAGTAFRGQFQTIASPAF